MDNIGGLPFFPIQFGKNGARVGGPAPIRPSGIRNLIVIAHGWKNDQAAADNLYSTLIGNMLALPGGDRLKDGKFCVTGIYWPSFAFKPDLTQVEDPGPAAGGAATLGNTDLARKDLEGFATEIAAFLELDDSFVAQAMAAVQGGDKADEFADRLRVEIPADGADPEMLAEHEGRNLPGRRLIEILSPPPAIPGPPAATGGAAMGGVAASGGRCQRKRHSVKSGPRAAVARLLNQFTYFEMKKRAGIVGANLGALIDADGMNGVGVHLIGHSFGGRLVTAAAARMQTVHPRSMVLLQAAYSHNGLGTGKGQVPKGAFRAVMDSKRVTGPIAITHTHNDSAVAIAYVIASRASGVNAESFGGPDDPFGGMGANGAQLMKPGEVVAEQMTPGQAPALQAGVITNLQADQVICDHNDVANIDVARMALQAVSS